MNGLERPPFHGIRKVVIVGAGAVGGYFGGLLSRAGSDVTFLVRPRTYAQISKNGLEVKSIDGDFLVHPPVVQSVAEIDSADLIVLAVKCYDVPEVLRAVEPLVKGGAILLTLQNGISSEDEILHYFNSDCVVAGVAYITSKRLAPGLIEHSENGIIALGELSGEKSDRAAAIHDLFSSTGISCFLKGNIRQAKWEKLCWNATFNPLSVILDAPVSLVLETPSLLERVKDGIREVAAVAKAEGITVHPEIVENTLAETRPIGAFYTSMYEDVKQGKPTEIDFLNGEVIRRGEKMGVPTPTHQLLFALIKGFEAKGSKGA